MKAAKQRARYVGVRDVLKYSPKPPSSSTVRRYYKMWRKERGLPERCDNEACEFHTRPLVWCGKAFRPTLDHINGNRKDNSADNLRYLCPNCESQLATRGGSNRGRVVEATEENKYVLRKPDGHLDTHLIMPVAQLSMASLDLKVIRKEPPAEQALPK